MQSIRPFGVFLFFLVLAGGALSLITPTSQKVERSVSIQVPVESVYEQVVKLENVKQWSAWSRDDSSAVYSLTGEDGKPGAVLSWEGNAAVSGEGRIEITGTKENEQVDHAYHFLKPRKMNALSTITLNGKGSSTTVTWEFRLQTPRPWNIFNLFSSLDKNMGADFEKGLESLRQQLEKTPAAGKPEQSLSVQTMDFPSTRFALIRQTVKWEDIPGFLDQHIAILREETSQQNVTSGAPTGLFYDWDEKNRQADLAAAVPVPAGTEFNHAIIRFEQVPANKAVYVTVSGDHTKLPDAHRSVRQYLENKKWRQKLPFLEQYVSGPPQEADTSRWITKLVYLVD